MKAPGAKTLWLLCSAVLLSASAPPAPPQAPAQVGGVWTGVLTQVPGGTQTLYGFQLVLTQEGAAVWGSSRVSISGSAYYASLRLRGQVRGDVLIVQEDSILREVPVPDGFWCVKRMVLKVVRADGEARLEGEWAAPDCHPGTIKLTRAMPPVRPLRPIRPERSPR